MLEARAEAEALTLGLELEKVGIYIDGTERAKR
jgi:hypothetical protein